jgi:hypothetical protein
MSTDRVAVVRIGRLGRHPSDPRLVLVPVPGGACVVPLGRFGVGDLAAHVPPGWVVPSTPEFAHLGEDRRSRVRRVGGVASRGLLVPAPPGLAEGDDASAALLAIRPARPARLDAGPGRPLARGPAGVPGPGPALEPWERHRGAFRPGEAVLATEKLDGLGARYCWRGGRLWAGSRAAWRRRGAADPWWRAAAATPALGRFCRDHPDLVVHGEVFGAVGGLGYGAGPGEVWFAAFGLRRGETWLDAEVALAVADGGGLPWVPVVRLAPYDPVQVRLWAEGPTLMNLGGHVREGVVLTPLRERTSPGLGRVALKVVGAGYVACGGRAGVAGLVAGRF